RRITPARRSLARPRAAGKLWMTAPLPLLAKRLFEKGFWKHGPKGPVAKGIPHLTPFSLKDLILRFRTIMNGYVNFYSFADNISSLGYIYYLLHGSLRCTICRKL